MPSVSPPYVDQESQQDAIKIKDVSDNTMHNINPLTEDYLKRILQDSNLATKLCTNPVLISTDKIDKASTGEKQNTDTSSVPLISSETRGLEALMGVTTNTHVSMPIVVYQRKDTVTSNVSTLVPNASVQAVLTVEKDGTQVHIGQEGSPASQIQGEEDKKKKEKDRTKESVLTIKLEEQIAI